MPPKVKYSTRSVTKPDVNEKVKELKQRQQNWFKQRETAKKDDSEVPAKSNDNGFRAYMRAKEEESNPNQNGDDVGMSYVISKSDPEAISAFDKPLSPEHFDDVADRIANRVKNELLMNSNDRISYTSNNLQPSASVTSLQSVQSSFSETDMSSALNSHVCPQCSSLMVESHEPMLIIPCGHNVCRQCSKEDDLCPVCACEIQSFTCNIMLKQIISNFKRESNRKGQSSRSSSRSHSTTAANSVREETDYTEELKSFMIRLEILEAECDSIRDIMRVIKQDVHSEQQQISRIEEEEDRVQKEMENLTKKLDALDKHKEQFQQNIDNLEDKHDKEAEKLNIVKDTIRGLNRSVEKIQLRYTSK